VGLLERVSAAAAQSNRDIKGTSTSIHHQPETNK
jgi:hypothetical protein